MCKSFASLQCKLDSVNSYPGGRLRKREREHFFVEYCVHTSTSKAVYLSESPCGHYYPHFIYEDTKHAHIHESGM